MKKKLIKELVADSLLYIQKLQSGEGVGVWDAPIVPSDCPTFDQATATYIREKHFRRYANTWIIPQLEMALDELTKN